MTLLSDFITKTGIGSGLSDQYIVDYYLRPAINRASELCVNYKEVEVTLTNGVNNYDLTDSNIATPVVGASGIESIVIDGSYITVLQYQRDFYINNLTNLYIVDNDLTYTGSLYLKYNAYYTKPTLTPSYIETDLPDNLYPAVIKYAQSIFGEDNLSYRGSNSSNGYNTSYEREQEENMSRTYGNVQTQSEVFRNMKIDAEKQMESINGKPKFDFIQII